MSFIVAKRGNSGIPVFDNKTFGIDGDIAKFIQKNPPASPCISRLPSFRHQKSRQKLTLATRKCVSSNVTPISSPVIPKSINNNVISHFPREFNKDVIETSARLINDIDATLSQLSKQYYSENNNSFDVSCTPVNDDDVTPTSFKNNNCILKPNHSANEFCDCKMLTKLKLKKPPTPNTTEDQNYYNSLPKSTNKHSHIPSSCKDTNKQKPVQSRPMKLQFPFETHAQQDPAKFVDTSQRTPKNSNRKSKYSTTSRTRNIDAGQPNSNATYTEEWLYSSRLPTYHHNQISNDLLHYMSNNKPDPTSSLKFQKNESYAYKSSSSSGSELFQKAIFNQHRHGNSKSCTSPEPTTGFKYIQRLPISTNPIQENKDETNANRDSGISSSKESWTEIPVDQKSTNNNNVSSLPQPPPRISSLIGMNINSQKCQTQTNQSLMNSDYLTPSILESKHPSKADRRKARELYATVKQRDEQRTKDVQPAVMEGPVSEAVNIMTNPPINGQEGNKKDFIETPSSDLEVGMVEGYCSDMDNLKNSGYFSDNSGYLSEGGLGVYAQKMQQRFREGLLAVQESLQMTSTNKISTRKFSNLDKYETLSTSSEEIEDYLKELSSRLVTPDVQDYRQRKDLLGARKSSLPCNQIRETHIQHDKDRLFKERLEKYAYDLEPAADFDITSSCSMDLLTGKAVSDVTSDDSSTGYKEIIPSGRDSSSDSKTISATNNPKNVVAKSGAGSFDSYPEEYTQKAKPRKCEILEAAGPTPATFDDNMDLRFEDSINQYRAMSLPGRPRRGSGWQADGISLTQPDGSQSGFPLASMTAQSNIYYDVPVTKKRQGRTTGGSCTPSFMHIRLPYATLAPGVKPSNSTSSLGKKEDTVDDIYDGLGSRLSLLSAGSYRSLNDERQATEIRRLRRELEFAQQKVKTLSGQLLNNGNLVAAFENSLQSMSLRLQRFAASSETKENELNELRNTIESLKKQASSSPTQIDHNPTSPKIYAASSLTSLSSTSNSAEKRSEGTSKKSSWLKNSLGRAFRKKSSKEEGSTESINDIQIKPNSPPLLVRSESESLQALKKELEEKDARLTDVQLDALSRSHQLEQLRDLLTKMRYEMSSLKADNSRLQNLMTVSNGGNSPYHQTEQTNPNDILDPADQNNSLKNTLKCKDLNLKPKFDFFNALVKNEESCKPLMVFVSINAKCKLSKSIDCLSSDPKQSVPIGRVGISSMTSWSDLENNLRRLIKEYVSAIDPFSNLGLNGEAISRYRINEETFISICNTGGMRPLTSPLATCAKSQSSRVSIELKSHVYGNSIDDMVFESLIPKPILQRYFGLLLEHKRIILCGPSGTGKTFLANKLAENLAFRYNRDPANSVLIFNVDHKSAKEIRTYMTTLTDQISKSESQNESNQSVYAFPLVIILDNLHHVPSFGEIFSSFLSIQHNKSPFVIGTMSLTNSSSGHNLQLHHNFRWILFTNHMEPVKGFLARYLRRQFLRQQLDSGSNLDQLFHVIEWISIVWQHINKFLELYSSSDVTIGPRLFLNCPMDVEKAKTWFIDLWNYSIVPYILEAVRDGLSTHGRKQATWDDPTDWIIRSWPWNETANNLPASGSPTDPSNLIRLRPEDVGFDSYQLITVASDSINPYSQHSIDHAIASSGRLSTTLMDMRQRMTDKNDHHEPIMFGRMSDRTSKR